MRRMRNSRLRKAECKLIELWQLWQEMASGEHGLIGYLFTPSPLVVIKSGSGTGAAALGVSVLMDHGGVTVVALSTARKRRPHVPGADPDRVRRRPCRGVGQRSAVLVEGDHRAVAVELLAQGGVVGVQRSDDGGGGVDLFTESVALGGHRREPASEFGQLFVAACLSGCAGVGGGQSGIPLGQDVRCAVHGGPADLIRATG